MAATILFKITGGEIIPEIEMLPSETILDLKRRIESFLNLKAERQTLRYEEQDLNNDRTIGYYNFNSKKGAIELVLHFKPLHGKPKFNVLVKAGYEDFFVKVKETTLVGELKKKMLKHMYSIDNMKFYHFSMEMDDDDLPLSAYYVSDGSKIEGKWFRPNY